MIQTMPSVSILPKEIFEKLHRCTCGNGIHTLEESQEQFRILCISCKHKGPAAKSIKVAIKLWNAEQLIR